MARIRPSSVPGAKGVIARIDTAMRWRADEQIGGHLDGVHGRLDEMSGRIDSIERKLDEFGERLGNLGHENFWTAEDVRRVTPQVAALETRFEQWRASAQSLSGTPAELAEAGGIVDEVRREHEQVRARLGGFAWYADRLRTLEERLDELSGASAVAEEGQHLVDGSVDIGRRHGGE